MGAKQSVAPFSATPLVDRIEKPKYVLLDTCYLISLMSSGYSIPETLSRLRQGNNEILTTGQVVAELENIASSRRKENDGSIVLTPRQMCEIRSMIYSGEIKVEDVEISPALRKAAMKLMRKNSPDGNMRLGEGEASLFALAHNLWSRGSYEVLSSDSDVKALFA
jgi:rRNA-processing protein FCF1